MLVISVPVMLLKACVAVASLANLAFAQGGALASFPDVNVDELNPLTLNWNQV